jgi:hypothetical protein
MEKMITDHNFKYDGQSRGCSYEYPEPNIGRCQEIAENHTTVETSNKKLDGQTSKMVSLNTEQPAPKRNIHPAVWDLVITDMMERDKIGESKYGTRLQPFNGRDALADAYQESLDQTVYLRQLIYERDKK